MNPNEASDLATRSTLDREAADMEDIRKTTSDGSRSST